MWEQWVVGIGLAAAIVGLSTGVHFLVPVYTNEVTMEIPAHAERLSPTMFRAHGENITTYYHVNHLRECDAEATGACCAHIGFTHLPRYDFEIRQPPADLYDTAIRQAVSEWDSNVRAPTTTMRPTRQAYDGDNEVGFGVLTLREFQGVLGLTQMHIATQSNVLVEFDQFYNLGNPISSGAYAYDMLSVARHEFGHVMGLDDVYSTNCQPYLMFGCLSIGQTKTIDTLTRACAAHEDTEAFLSAATPVAAGAAAIVAPLAALCL